MMLKDMTLKSLLQKKKTPKPSEEMENAIMNIIQKNVKYASQQKHSFRLAWIFFIIGLFLGVLLSIIYIDSDTIVFGINLSDKGLIRYLICVFIILMLFETLYSNAIAKNKFDRNLNPDNYY
jgi:membrane-anchored glycerophosphoryl diester phosphodiesterase (GDPDase)